MRYAPLPGCRLAIGLTGAARHGKDSAARALLKALPGAERFALSDMVSADCRVNLGMTTRDPVALQQRGTAARVGRPFVWMDALYGLLQDREPEVVIVTGLRYADEVDMVRALAPLSLILRVVRIELNGARFVTTDRDPNHPVERGIAGLPFDAEIVARSGDIDGLQRAAVAGVLAAVGG